MLGNTEPSEMVDRERHQDIGGDREPAKAPAPTFSTNSRPVITANAPITPPNGAHHGMFPKPSAVGRGRGWQSHSTASKATIGTKETMLASHGLVSALRRAPFIGGPQA